MTALGQHFMLSAIKCEVNVYHISTTIHFCYEQKLPNQKKMVLIIQNIYMNILQHHILQQISSDSVNSYNNAKINRVNKAYVLDIFLFLATFFAVT